MDRLLASLTSEQLTEWLAYAELEPFGGLADERRLAKVCAVIANTAFGRKKGSRVFTEEDFSRCLKKPTAREPWQKMAEHLKAFTLAMGGEVRSAPRPPGDS